MDMIIWQGGCLGQGYDCDTCNPLCYGHAAAHSSKWQFKPWGFKIQHWYCNFYVCVVFYISIAVCMKKLSTFGNCSCQHQQARPLPSHLNQSTFAPKLYYYHHHFMLFLLPSMTTENKLPHLRKDTHLTPLCLFSIILVKSTKYNSTLTWIKLHLYCILS